MHFSGTSKKSNSYRNIHNAGKCKDKNDVKESEEVSVGGEGGEEEADEGDAAEVGGGQGEQAEKQLHCSSHLFSGPICVFSQGTELVFAGFLTVVIL